MTLGYSLDDIDAIAAALDRADEHGDHAAIAVLLAELERLTAWQALPHQTPPDSSWGVWALMGGRGTGKSDGGSAWINAHMLGPACDPRVPGGHRGRIIAPTFGDAIASCVNGPSGVRAHNPDVRLVGTKEGTMLRWPNGSEARIFGAHTPGDVDRLRAGTNACLTGDTPVMTRDGDTPIALVRPGDEVWTRSGWRPVLRSWCTGIRYLWELRTDDGRRIVGTDDHLVLADGTWTPLASVTPGARVSAWTRSSTEAGSTAADATATTSTSETSCTGLSTPPSSDRSRPAGASTTATATRPTTGRRTSKRSRPPTTPDSTRARTDGTPPEAARRPLPAPSSTSSAQRAERRSGRRTPPPAPAPTGAGIASTAPAAPARAGATPSAPSAVRSSDAGRPRPVPAAPSRVATVAPLGLAAPVYDLTVADAHEFCADGIIVHNCVDWFEELAAQRHHRDAWDQAAFGRRLGSDPRAIVTTTPRNLPLIRELDLTGRAYATLAWLHRFGLGPAPDVRRRQRVVVTRGSTADNPHLDDETRADLYAAYGGTRLGEQELEGLILDDLGTVFSRSWFGYRDGYGRGSVVVRYWDLAATEDTGANDPDWTAGVRVSVEPGAGTPLVLPDGRTVPTHLWNVDDVVRVRASPSKVAALVVETARRDGPDVPVWIEQDPAQAGKDQVERYRALLRGIAKARGNLPTGPKLTRSTAVSVPAEQGNVTLTRADWNRAFLDELESFDGDRNGGWHDDQVDATSGAFAMAEAEVRRSSRSPIVAPGGGTKASEYRGH